MRVNERLRPGALLLVGDLEGVGQDGLVILVREVLERGREELAGLVRTAELRLRNLDRVLLRDRRRGRRDLDC